MRRILAVVGVGVVAGAVLLLSGCAGPTAQSVSAPSPTPPLRLLVAGDSISVGYYASSPDLAYGPLLAHELNSGGAVTRTTIAVSGARAFRVAAEVEDVTVGAAPYDVVVLEVGANDVGKTTLAEWTTGYRRLLDAVAATSPDAVVACLGPWNAPRASQPYESVVRRLCRDHDYVRLSDLYATSGLRGPAGSATSLGPRDTFHPNDAGHAAIAERLFELLDTEYAAG